MVMSEIRYKPIGVVHSPFKKPSGVPIQPTAAEGVKGSIEVFPEYADGLKDLDGFSHIILVYHFHLSKKPLLMVRPYMDEELHGVFATRAPSRPNPIGISTLHLLRAEKNMLHVEDLDIVDGTPVLDIKPFVPEFDVRKTSGVGWLKKNLHKLSSVRDDGRFLE